VFGRDVCSNFAGSFAGGLDYVWYSAERLRVTRVMEQIDYETLTASTALPNPQYSSDHIALMCEFELSVR
jgi:mRNA deadenylase 3'-5' endonuclease subunit Ccr4